MQKLVSTKKKKTEVTANKGEGIAPKPLTVVQDETLIETPVAEPTERLLELESHILDFLKADLEGFNQELNHLKEQNDYKAAVEQRKAAFDRFVAIKQSLTGAENDFLKADATLAAHENRISEAKNGYSKKQNGILRGILIAKGIDPLSLKAVSLVKEGEATVIKY